jgi:hypothetical protein
MIRETTSNNANDFLNNKEKKGKTVFTSITYEYSPFASFKNKQKQKSNLNSIPWLQYK